jgi:hypothetical protein
MKTLNPNSIERLVSKINKETTNQINVFNNLINELGINADLQWQSNPISFVNEELSMAYCATTDGESISTFRTLKEWQKLGYRLAYGQSKQAYYFATCYDSKGKRTQIEARFADTQVRFLGKKITQNTYSFFNH